MLGTHCDARGRGEAAWGEAPPPGEGSDISWCGNAGRAAGSKIAGRNTGLRPKKRCFSTPLPGALDTSSAFAAFVSTTRDCHCVST